MKNIKYFEVGSDGIVSVDDSGTVNGDTVIGFTAEIKGQLYRTIEIVQKVSGGYIWPTSTDSPVPTGLFLTKIESKRLLLESLKKLQKEIT